MLIIDGSLYEGGGQILRIGVALAVILKRKTKIIKIRAGRSKPGLGNQHLAGLTLVEQLCGGMFIESDGSRIRVGSNEIIIDPEQFKPTEQTEYVIDCGTAGSIALMAQIALPVAIWMKEKLSLRLMGGTDADFAPPIDIQKEIFRPLVEKFGVNLTINQLRRGFFPRGNGEVEYIVEPVTRLNPITIRPVENISITAKCWFSARDNVEKIEKQMEMAANVLKSFHHDKIKHLSTEVIRTKERSVGNGAGVYLLGKNEDIVCSSTELAKFDRKSNMRGTGEKLATEAWKRLVEDIGTGY